MTATELLDAKAVAAILGISEEQVKRRTKRDHWPHIRLSAKAIRYRAEHVEQIIARHEQVGEQTVSTSLAAGLTARSRRRSA